MILTVTLNAALDKTLVVPHLRLGAPNRPSAVVTVAGGKGINVTRVLHALGETVVATGLVAGEVGHQITALLDAEGVDHAFQRLSAGESRTCLAIVGGDGTPPTEIYEPGPPLLPEDYARFLDRYALLLRGARWVALSGSLPPGVDDDLYLDLMHLADQAGVAVSLDTSGPALGASLSGRPHVVKPNQEEAEALLGVAITPETLPGVVEAILDRGAALVALSLGRTGAVVANRQEAWFVEAPDVSVLNPVGSGDSFLAALISAKLACRPLAEVGAYAVAAGSANATVAGAAACTRAQVEALYPHVKARPLSEAAWTPLARRSP